MEIIEDFLILSYFWNGYDCDIGRVSDIIFIEIGNWITFFIIKVFVGYFLLEFIRFFLIFENIYLEFIITV